MGRVRASEVGGEEVVGGIGAVEYWRWPWSATRSL
jgi:hypothetical protein